MECLQMLKCALKKDRLNFTKGWAVLEKDLQDDGSDGGILAQLLSCDNADTLDNILKTLLPEGDDD